MATCTNCGLTLVGGRRDENGIFCSRECQAYYAHPGYCSSCIADTADKSADISVTVWGIGSGMFGRSDRCPVCSSVVQHYGLKVFFVPVWSFGRFRVLYSTPSSYYARALRNPEG